MIQDPAERVADSQERLSRRIVRRVTALAILLLLFTTIAYWKAYDKVSEGLTQQTALAQSQKKELVATKKEVGKLNNVIAGHSATLAELKTLVKNQNKELALLLADHKITLAQTDSLKSQENQVLELLAVQQQEFLAENPKDNIHVVCGLSKSNDLECKVTKTPKKGTT
jgi:hypothetical protein